jgi:hypothetical protein
MIADPIPLMWSNISSSSIQNTQPLMFFEKYSLEIQKQQQEKQKNKVKFQKTQKTDSSVTTPSPSSLEKEEDLYPPKNPEKQPSSQQLTITLLKYDGSSDSVQSPDSIDSQSSFEYESIDTQSSWSMEEEQVDLTEILMADTQPSTSQAPASIGPEVSEVDSDIKQTSNLSPEQTAVPPEAPRKTKSNGPFFTIDDVPYPLRHKRLNEFRAWVNSQLAKGVSLRQALTEFCSLFIGFLSN